MRKEELMKITDKAIHVGVFVILVFAFVIFLNGKVESQETPLPAKDIKFVRGGGVSGTLQGVTQYGVVKGNIVVTEGIRFHWARERKLNSREWLLIEQFLDRNFEGKYLLQHGEKSGKPPYVYYIVPINKMDFQEMMDYITTTEGRTAIANSLGINLKEFNPVSQKVNVPLEALLPTIKEEEKKVEGVELKKVGEPKTEYSYSSFMWNARDITTKINYEGGYEEVLSFTGGTLGRVGDIDVPFVNIQVYKDGQVVDVDLNGKVVKTGEKSAEELRRKYWDFRYDISPQKDFTDEEYDRVWGSSNRILKQCSPLGGFCYENWWEEMNKLNNDQLWFDINMPAPSELKTNLRRISTSKLGE